MNENNPEVSSAALKIKNNINQNKFFTFLKFNLHRRHETPIVIESRIIVAKLVTVN